MVTFYIARHGQNVDNQNGILNGHRDLPLTEIGEQQAVLLGEQIHKSGLRFDSVYASPLIRAWKTAEVVCTIAEQPKFVIEKDLIERNFGIMSGKRLDEIEAICAPNIIKTETITYFLEPEGGESFPVLIQRAKDLLERMTAKHSDEHVLLVCHGDFGKMIYAAYYKEDWETVLTGFHFGNSEVLVLSDRLQLPEQCASEGHCADVTQTESERRLFTTQQYNL